MSTKPTKSTVTSRKRVTASVHAKVSTKKIRKANLMQDGSFIQQTHPVSTVSTSSPTNLQPHVPVHENESVLTILSQIQASNQQLADRLEKLERCQPDTFISAPASLRLYSLVSQGTLLPNTINEHFTSQHQAAGRTSQQTSILQNTSSPSMGQQQNPNLRPSTADLPRNAIMPSLDSLRRLPNVSEAVSNILASYDQQAKHESLQGKNSRRSGRYNNFDTVSNPPERRWPNEGYHGSNGKKCLLCDDRSMPQRVAWELTNTLHMQDPLTSKQALTQVLCAMKDAVSLPFTAVKNAWVCSMHELEEGNLSWADSTQWVLNRLSASQVSLVNSQSVSQKRQCRYYNKGSCSHNGHHGLSKHNCSFCSKQGRTSNHPENKCNFKYKKQEKVNISSS